MNIQEIAQQMGCTPFQVVEKVVQQKISDFHLDNKNAEMEATFKCPFCGSTHKRKQGTLHTFKNYVGSELCQTGGRFLQATHSYEFFDAYLCPDCSEKRYAALAKARIFGWVAVALTLVVLYAVIATAFNWDNAFAPFGVAALITALFGYLSFNLDKTVSLKISKFNGAKSKLHIYDAEDALPWKYFHLAPMCKLSKGDNLSSVFNSSAAQHVMKQYGIDRTSFVGEAVVLDPQLTLNQKEALLSMLAKGESGISSRELDRLFSVKSSIKAFSSTLSSLYS